MAANTTYRFAPRRSANLTRLCGGEERRFECQPADAFSLAELGEEGGHVGVGQCCVMTVALAGLTGKALAQRAHRRLRRAEPLRIGPIEHRPDPLAHPSGRLRLIKPNFASTSRAAGPSTVSTVMSPSLGKACVKRRYPLRWVLAVLPTPLVLVVNATSGGSERRDRLALPLLLGNRVNSGENLLSQRSRTVACIRSDTSVVEPRPKSRRLPFT